MPVISAIKATWNNVLTTFTAIEMDVTDTASASGSKLMDLQVGGVSKFSVDKTGIALDASGKLMQYKVYDTVTLLLASTEDARGTGAIWEAGGFRYIEVPSGGDVTNSAGTPVQLDVLQMSNGMYASKAFGALFDGVTDDTAAHQAAINAAATNGFVGVYFHAGRSKFTKLYLHYDAANNTGYPSDSSYQGRIKLLGAGRMSKRNFANAAPVGIWLDSTDTTGPAIHCDGDPLALDQNRTDNVKIEDMSITATNTTAVIQFERVVQDSGISHCFVRQGGAGNGIDWHTIWISYIRDTTVEGAGLATSGTGVYLRNLSTGLSGGIVDLTNVVVNDFDINWQLGHKTYGSGERLHSLVMSGCQGGDGNFGMVIGHGMDQVSLSGTHFEVNATDLFIGNGADRILVEGCSFVNSVVMAALGDGTANGDRYDGIVFRGNKFISNATTTKHFNVFGGSNAADVLLDGNAHTGDAGATETAMFFEAVLHHNVRVISPKFGPNLTANYSNDDRVQESQGENSHIWKTPTTGALSAVPFQFETQSITAGQPPASFRQADISEPFLQFATGFTPSTGSNHISTVNAGAATGPGATNWTFSRMVLVQTDDATGITDYWMPLFTKV